MLDNQNNTVHNSKELEVACVIEEFKREKLTGKIELDFKNGELTSGRKSFGFIK